MTGKINILLITLDQWRADCMSAVNHPCLRTPNIDALAADGTLFRQHFTVASPCGPARASLLTGLYLHNHESVRNGIPLDRRHTNLALELAGAGYSPTLFGFTDTALDPRGLGDEDGQVAYPAMLPGFLEGLHLPGDGWPWVNWLSARGYARPGSARDMWLPRNHPRSRIDDSPPAYRADESETSFLTDAAISFIERQDRPWFVHLSYFRPHHPYIAPEPYNHYYGPGDVPAPVKRETREEEAAQHPWLAAQLARQLAGLAPVQDGLPMQAVDEAAVAQLRALYCGTINECDDAIGRLTAMLKRLGQYDRTLIVLTSDHGDMLGDHWLWAAEGYFDAAYQIPLIIKGAGSIRAAGRQVEEFTESVDIAPTILRAAGAPLPAAFDGRPLQDLMEGEKPAGWRDQICWEFDFRDTPSPALASSLGLKDQDANLTVLRTRSHKYVHFPSLPPLLFDLGDDPSEFRNLLAQAGHERIALDHAERMLSWRERSSERAATAAFD